MTPPPGRTYQVPMPDNSVVVVLVQGVVPDGWAIIISQDAVGMAPIPTADEITAADSPPAARLVQDTP